MKRKARIVSESESESEPATQDVGLPSNEMITLGLQDVVADHFKQKDFDDLTIKSVRAKVTAKLALPDDFFKLDPEWKTRSKHVIQSEVAEQEKSRNGAERETSAAEENGESEGDLSMQTEKKNGAVKKRKPSQADSKVVKKKKTVNSSGKKDAESVNSSHKAVMEDTVPSTTTVSNIESTENQLGPDSELSDLVDEEPPPKVQRKKTKSSQKHGDKSKPKGSGKNSKSKANSKADVNITPQEAEIKKLQSWLMKCGIRKLWGKELAKFDSPKEKTEHLKGLLNEVGMTGRFSEEKARQIKEERELKADLEAIQDGEERWGKKDDVPKRRLARGLQDLEELGLDEESD